MQKAGCVRSRVGERPSGGSAEGHCERDAWGTEEVIGPKRGGWSWGHRVSTQPPPEDPSEVLITWI